MDNERGVRMAVGHLAALGHRRIAHIAGPQEMSTGLSRYRGFVTAMESSGLQVDSDLVVFAKAFTVEEGLRCTRLLLDRGSGCTAIAAGNDMLAVGCYAALDEAELTCPEDMSVVGFNDMPFIDRLRPPLTTIRFPHYQVGTEAAQLLLERIAEHAGPVEDPLPRARADRPRLHGAAPGLTGSAGLRGPTPRPPRAPTHLPFPFMASLRPAVAAGPAHRLSWRAIQSAL